MKLMLKLISAVGLGFTIVPSLFVMSGHLSWEIHSKLMLLGFILWLGSAVFWMKKEA